MNPAPHPSEHLLRQHYRRIRHAWPLAVLNAGLALTLAIGWWRHPSWDRVEKWNGWETFWPAGVALTLVGALALWIFRRRNLLHSAKSLDSRLDAKNRLETATIFQHDSGALARAQREETANFLRDAPAKPRDTVVRALAALAVLLALAHLATLLSWTRPWSHPVPKVAAAQPTPAPPQLPQASIQWKSPEAQTKAAPIEEVPLTAVANSTSGLRDLVLEAEVNGEPKPPVSIPLEALAKKGEHKIETSIYLDQLDVQPFDIVSYYLHARRIDARKLPETVSPVQFVEIKPFRDDVAERKGGSGDTNASFALLTALKGAQLRLIKENFVLAHAEIGHDDADWKKENQRVGHEQAVLKEKTAQAVQKMTLDGVPAEVVDLLTQAEPFMVEAAKKIDATQNQPGLTPQGKSLGMITEVEKFFVKVVAQGGGSVHGKTARVDDPFKDKKQLELKKRSKTQAGELELLAQEQEKIAADLAKPEAPATATPAPSASPAGTPDPGKIEGTLAERQTQIAQRIGALLNGQTFLPEITQHLQQGHDGARAALHQIDAADLAAAREPAAGAARELRLAIEAMDKAGDAQAKEQLADAEKALQQAAEAARSAPEQTTPQDAQAKADEAAKRTAETAQKLAEAAQRQQETGSAKEAQHLNELAKALSQADLRKALDQMRSQPHATAPAEKVADRLQQLADAAGQVPRGGPPTPAEIAHLLDQMERAQANLHRLAEMETGSRVPKAGAAGGASPAPGSSTPGQMPGEQPGSAKNPGTEGKEPGAGGRQGEHGQGKEGQQGQQGEHGEGKEGQHGQGQQGQGQQGQGQQGQGQQGQGQQGQGQQGQGQQGQGQQGQGQQGQGQQGQGQQGQGQQGQGQQGQGQGKGHGNGQGQGSEAEPSQETASADQATAPADATGTGGGGGAGGSPSGGRRISPELRRKFTQEILDELHDSLADPAFFPTDYADVTRVRKAARVIQNPDKPELKPLLGEIDEPLDRLIKILRQSLPAAARTYQLADEHVDPAPAAYRDAVADYFEQLSRDYQPAASPTPAAEETGQK